MTNVLAEWLSKEDVKQAQVAGAYLFSYPSCSFLVLHNPSVSTAFSSGPVPLRFRCRPTYDIVFTPHPVTFTLPPSSYPGSPYISDSVLARRSPQLISPTLPLLSLPSRSTFSSSLTYTLPLHSVLFLFLTYTIAHAVLLPLTSV
ncbi:hypothetical protein C8R45DRAFT_1105496 [Mycena sanguinolenta]|nr:hypothetical protein C8R45DRAFT_1105496 [Mycena sanguinolenta]